MTNATGTSTYSYNENNWLTSIEKNGEPQISYAYDEIGNITSVTDKLGNTTGYTYGKSSRMLTVSFNGRTITYEYDENGNRKRIDYNGSVEEAYTYNKNNKLLELTNKKSDGNEISRYSYTYDLVGRQTSKTDSYGTTGYTYDKAGRILKVEAPGKTTVYAYDGAGNRVSQDETYTSEQVLPAIDGTGISEIKYIIKRSEYAYSNANRLLKLVEKLKDAGGMELLQKITTFRYDNNGNELRRTVEYVSLFNKANPKAYEAAVNNENTTEPIHAVVDQTISKYDGFNRMVRTELIKSTTRTVVEYVYNGDGLRVQKTVRRSDKGNTSEVISYLYDRQYVILETSGTNSIRYARGINYIGRIDNAGILSYFLFNGHGDVVQTTSEAGDIENQYDYDIFGNPTLTIESYLNSIRYAGEFYDTETGLYYLRARYYDPYIGRFISEDSYWGEDNNPLSLNLYTYANNDPLKYIDPTGHRAENNMDGGSRPKPSSSNNKSGGASNNRGRVSSSSNWISKLITNISTIISRPKENTPSSSGSRASVGNTTSERKTNPSSNSTGTSLSVGSTAGRSGSTSSVSSSRNNDDSNIRRITTPSSSNSSSIRDEDRPSPRVVSSPSSKPSGNTGVGVGAIKSSTITRGEEKAKEVTTTGGNSQGIFRPAPNNVNAAYESMIKAGVPAVYAGMAAAGLRDANATYNATPAYLRMTPVIGTGIDAYELKTGTDLFYGKKLNTTDKALTTTSLGISLIPGAKALVAVAHADDVGDAVRTVDNAIDITSDVSKGTVKSGTLSNVEARTWYLQQESKIPGMINKNLTLEQQAQQAVNLRNQFRTHARDLMSDRDLAASLNKTDPNMTWEQAVKKYSDKGLQGDALYNEIINAAQRSRTSVNESLGIK